MKSCIIHLRGLGDKDESGSWCGAKRPLQALADQFSLVIVPGNWDDAGISRVVDRQRDLGFEFVGLGGHSHGAWAADKIAARYGPIAFDFLYYVDNCPFLNPAAQFGPALPFPEAAAFGYACWQHNSEPAGRRYLPRKTVVARDLTPLRDPKLGHIDFPGFGMNSIAGDDRVWWGIDSIEQQLKAALDARAFLPAVAAPDGPRDEG